MDIDGPHTNGLAKRKSRSSVVEVSYKDESDDSEDTQPLVRNWKSVLAAAPVHLALTVL
jgi:predicted phage tail protein